MGTYAFTLKPEGEKSTINAMKRGIFEVFQGGIGELEGGSWRRYGRRRQGRPGRLGYYRKT